MQATFGRNSKSTFNPNATKNSKLKSSKTGLDQTFQVENPEEIKKPRINRKPGQSSAF